MLPQKERQMNTAVKQIIVIRTKYPDNNGGSRKLRTGKLIAQAAHASMAFLTNKIRAISPDEPIQLTEEQRTWIFDKFTKICVYVESEEELLDVYNKALENNLTATLITDSGLTEFNNVPTNTAVAIGPHESHKMEPITGHLPLY
jgi:PTH2 family peptidyl-tRNA hydrolase